MFGPWRANGMAAVPRLRGVEAPGPVPPVPVRGREVSRALRLIWVQTRVVQSDARLTLARIIDGLGKRSVPLLILVPSLLLVSPLSAIPGMTTTLGLIVALLLAQRLAGRRTIWLPRALGRITVPAGRLDRALRWLRRPAARIDRLLQPRFEFLAAGPVSRLPMAVVALAACCAPLMEVIPMSGTTVGAAITLFAAGLLGRDGVFVIIGATFAALLPLGLWLILT